MPPSRTRLVGTLPTPLSVFIGREREIAELKDLLAAHRLVTITGPGGSGKTRLALRVANELQGEYEDGVWLAELASLSDGALVTQTIASHLNVREQPARPLIDSLVDYLFPLHGLLLIDNCEHLIDACAQFAAAILQRCPNLTILATSRELLGIAGETVWTIPPLTLPREQPWKSPASAQNALNVYGQSEAVQLFMDRAASIVRDFALTTDTAPWVSEICRRLDGMPLAIELAAARTSTLSIRDIAQRLDDRFHLLTGGSRTAQPRQQTLEATLDWSYTLLSETERRVLQRLSTFSGGATLEAAEAVCAGEGVDRGQILDTLSHLVEKSLVVVDKPEGGETRYHLLETIRQYALQRLRDSSEIEGIYRRHLDWFFELAEQAEPELQAGNQGDWLEELAHENDNFRVALAWSLQNDTTMALQLAGTLGQYWYMRGHHFEEGIDWLGKAIGISDGVSQVAIRAKALLWLGQLASFHGDYSMARSAFENSLDMYRHLNDKDGLAQSSFFLADVVANQGDDVAARTLFKVARSFSEASLAGFHGEGNKWSIARTLNVLGELARIENDYDTARGYYEESLRVRRELGDQRGIAVSLINLGYCAYHEGDYRQAKDLFEESLANLQHLGSTRGMVDCLAALAGVLAAEKKPERATRLFGAAAALHESTRAGLAAAYADRIEYDHFLAIARSQLSRDAFDAILAQGRAMTLDQAVDYALSEHEIPISDVSLKEKFGGLTAREREVAALISQGKSNREIAAVMTVGARTVETYVTRILNKLGFDSRVQIATWMIEKGLDKKELP